MHEPPPPLGARAKDAPESLVNLVMAMLAKVPAERPKMGVVEAELAMLTGVSTIVSSSLMSGNRITPADPIGMALSTSRPNPVKTSRESIVDPFGSTLDGVVGQPNAPASPRLRAGGSWRGLWAAGLLVLSVGGLVALGTHFSRGAGAKAAELLSQAQVELRERRWLEVQLHADQVLRFSTLLPGQRETAQDLKDRAQREAAAQQALDTMRAEEQAGHVEAVVRRHQQIPPDSVYASAGQDIFERAAPLFESTHLAKAEEERKAGRCAEFAETVALVTQLLPSSSEARQVGARDCLAKEISEQAARTAAQAQQQLARWVATQNAPRAAAPAVPAAPAAPVPAVAGALPHDDGAAGLYTERFLGLRHEGVQLVARDRAQWLRERLPRPGVSVEATEVHVTATDTTARLSLILRRQSGPQAALIPVELVLVYEGDTLRIAREEQSAPRSPAGTAPQPTMTAQKADAFAFVEGMDLLFPLSPEEGWARGAPVLDKTDSEGDSEVMRASRSVDLAQLPAEVLRWQGRRVQLWGLTGPRCEARVVRFKLVGRLLPHAATRKHWAASDAAETAREIWELSAGGRSLAAELEPDRGSCPTPGPAAFLWARAVEMPVVPTLALPHEALPPLRQAALRALRALPGSVGQGLPDADLEVTALTQNGTTLVSLSSRRPAGCAGQPWLLWRVDAGAVDAAKPVLKLVSPPRWGRTGSARALLDLDNDGVPEVLFWSGGLGERLGILRAHDGIYDEVEIRKIPTLDSSC